MLSTTRGERRDVNGRGLSPRCGECEGNFVQAVSARRPRGKRRHVGAVASFVELWYCFDRLIRRTKLSISFLERE